MQKPEARKYLSPLNLISFALGLALLAALLYQVDFPGLVHSLLTIQPAFLFLGGMIYLAKSLVRSFRFWRINARVGASYPRMLRLSLASSLASQLLPLKLGEFVYVFLIKREFGASLSSGVSSLVIVRIFDLLAIALLFLLSALGFGQPAGTAVYFTSVLVFFALLAAALAVLIGAGEYVARAFQVLVDKTFLRRVSLARTLQQGLANTLADVARYRGKTLVGTAASALLEWAVNYAMYHALLLGMGYAPRWIDTIIAVSFAALASVLPVNSFGNFGTQEAGWATGLVLSGFSRQAAITTGFATHLLSLAFMLVLGGAAWVSALASYGISPGDGSQRSGSPPSGR